MTAHPVDLSELREATATIRRIHLWMWDTPGIRGTEPERNLLQAQRILEQHCRDLALPPVTLRSGRGPRV